jgi:hypothetical protein
MSHQEASRVILAKAENGDRFISLKWFSAIMITCMISVMGAWAAQRHAVEASIVGRLAVLEWNQSRVLALLESNRETLGKVYDELKEHRNTGK